MNGYIKKHWRGDQSLLRSLGLNTVCLSLCLIYLLSLFSKLLKEYLGVSDLAIMVVSVTIGINVLVWQSVGAFRAAHKRIESYGSSANLYGALALVLTCGVYVFTNILDQFVGDIDYAQQEIEEYKPPKPSHRLTLHESGVITLTGDIDYGASREMRALLQQSISSTQLILNSEGGVIAEARGLAKVVKDNQLNTSVSSRCYSACTIVFIAGQQRSLKPNAQLGFHQYSKPPLPWINLHEEQLRDLQYFKEKNVAPWFLDKIYTAKHHDIWIPSINTLVEAGVVTYNMR